MDYLVTHEWAAAVEDVLWRRTKLGLLFSEQQVAALSEYLNPKVPLE